MQARNLKINKPCTVYISFTGPNPAMFNLHHEKHGLYYFRDLQGKIPRIKFNLCHSGVYKSNVNFDVIKVVPIEIPESLPVLPEYERKDIKDFQIVKNPNLIGSPARVFVKEGIIEHGRDYYKYPKPVRVFITLHEIGHFFYGLTTEDFKKAEQMSEAEGQNYLRWKKAESEKKCDLFALIHYLQMGYNRSMAFYSLKKVLSRSQDNINRIKSLVNNIEKTQNKKIAA